MRVLPIGPNRNGSASGVPSTVVRRSQAAVATARRGRNVTASNTLQFAAQRDLVVRAAVDVVEHDARQAAFGEAPEVGDVHDVVRGEPSHAGILFGPAVR